jgi:Histone-like Protein p6
MSRKMMTKEVTSTNVQIAKMELVDGQPVAKPLDPVVLIGNRTLESAQKEVNKMFKGENVTVFNVEAETVTYEMEVSEFIKLASVKVKQAEETPEEVQA